MGGAASGALGSDEGRIDADALGARLRATRVVARREVGLTLFGTATALSVTAALAAIGWITWNQLQLVLDGDVLVLADPFRPSLGVAVLLLSLGFGIAAVVAVARERENGTLETLFYGPIDEPTYLLGKLLGVLVAFVITIALVLFGIGVLGLMTGFAVTITVVVATLVSALTVAGVIAFGLLLAAISTRLRTAILLFVGVTLVMVGTSAAYGFLVGLPVDDASSPLLAARDALGSLDQVARAISPYALMDRAVASAAIGAWDAAGIAVGLSLVITMAMLAAASVALRRSGVRRRHG